jgi:Protein of unknown function (DUF5674)
MDDLKMSLIKIVREPISFKELETIAQATYKEMVKAVADVEKEIIAVGGELHADAEAVLLEAECRQENLWGINIYLEKPKNDRIQYTSFINIRPRHLNFSLELKDEKLRLKIRTIVDRLIPEKTK